MAQHVHQLIAHSRLESQHHMVVALLVYVMLFAAGAVSLMHAGCAMKKAVTDAFQSLVYVERMLLQLLLVACRLGGCQRQPPAPQGSAWGQEHLLSLQLHLTVHRMSALLLDLL